MFQACRAGRNKGSLTFRNLMSALRGKPVCNFLLLCFQTLGSQQSCPHEKGSSAGIAAFGLLPWSGDVPILIFRLSHLSGETISETITYCSVIAGADTVHAADASAGVNL